MKIKTKRERYVVKQKIVRQKNSPREREINPIVVIHCHYIFSQNFLKTHDCIVLFSLLLHTLIYSHHTLHSVINSFKARREKKSQ